MVNHETFRLKPLHIDVSFKITMPNKGSNQMPERSTLIKTQNLTSPSQGALLEPFAVHNPQRWMLRVC